MRWAAASGFHFLKTVWQPGIYGLLLIACTDPLGDGTGALTGQTQCLECHSQNGPLLEDDADAGNSVSAVEWGHSRHQEAGIQCETCHIMPVEVGDASHIGPLPSEVVFFGMAVSGGAQPVWNAVTSRCEGTYCHGGTTRGGTNTSPSFYDVPVVPMPCTNCHGTAPDTGTHARHTQKGVLCTECHLVPVEVSAPGHVDGAPAEIVFGGRALFGGVQPIYTKDSICANTYCHGVTLNSGTNLNPRWVALGPGDTACSFCHGNPPQTTHFPEDTDCMSCHEQTVQPDGTVNWQGGFHMNGIVE